jgi:hypothetical protein
VLSPLLASCALPSRQENVSKQPDVSSQLDRGKVLLQCSYSGLNKSFKTPRNEEFQGENSTTQISGSKQLQIDTERETIVDMNKDEVQKFPLTVTPAYLYYGKKYAYGDVTTAWTVSIDRKTLAYRLVGETKDIVGDVEFSSDYGGQCVRVPQPQTESSI